MTNRWTYNGVPASQAVHITPYVLPLTAFTPASASSCDDDPEPVPPFDWPDLHYVYESTPGPEDVVVPPAGTRVLGADGTVIGVLGKSEPIDLSSPFLDWTVTVRSVPRTWQSEGGDQA